MWTIITRDQCNFCDDTKALLKASGFKWQAINVSQPENRWLATLLKKADLSTVPQVFFPDGTYLGGYTKLREHIVRGW